MSVRLRCPAMKRAIIILAAVSALAACGGGDDTDTETAVATTAPVNSTTTTTAAPTTTASAAPVNPIRDAARQCGTETQDGGTTIVMDTNGEEDFDDPYEFSHVYCVLEALGAPERVVSHIESTRALDGTQDDDWGELHARWTYHPDDGLDITLWFDA